VTHYDTKAKYQQVSFANKTQIILCNVAMVFLIVSDAAFMFWWV